MDLPTYINAATNADRLPRSEASLADTFSAVQMEVIAADDNGGATSDALARHGISMSDNSDVGPGRRFENLTDKLSAVMEVFTAIINPDGGGAGTKDSFFSSKS